jgi:hypothetical protein
MRKFNIHKAEELRKNYTEKAMFLVILIYANKKIIEIFLMTPF